MIPHKQLYRHDPGNEILGDCWRSAIACLLDLQPWEVPHFMVVAGDESVDAMTDDFLSARGLRVIKVPYPGDLPMRAVLESVGKLNPGVHHFFSGTSRNGTDHVVIARDGEIVHDTAIDDSGIVGPMSDGNWWVEFLGARV